MGNLHIWEKEEILSPFYDFKYNNNKLLKDQGPQVLVILQVTAMALRVTPSPQRSVRCMPTLLCSCLHLLVGCIHSKCWS